MIEWVLLEIFSDVPKNSQNFVEKAHYPNATPLKISIRTHSIPACFEAGRVQPFFQTVNKFHCYCVLHNSWNQITSLDEKNLVTLFVKFTPLGKRYAVENWLSRDENSCCNNTFFVNHSAKKMRTLGNDRFTGGKVRKEKKNICLHNIKTDN